MIKLNPCVLRACAARRCLVQDRICMYIERTSGLSLQGSVCSWFLCCFVCFVSRNLISVHMCTRAKCLSVHWQRPASEADSLYSTKGSRQRRDRDFARLRPLLLAACLTAFGLSIKEFCACQQFFNQALAAMFPS